MDQISMKTPNSKCRLYWFNRVYRLEIVNLRPSNLLTGSSTPPPSLCELVQCVTGGGGGGIEGLRHINIKHLPPSTFIGQFLRKADI
jgi:hypothetical protein